MEKSAELNAGLLSAEAAGLKPVEPLIDLSKAIKEALLQRAHTTNSGHTDPREVFNPGLASASYNNLGMGAKVSSSAIISPGAPPTEIPPGAGR